MIGDIKKGRDKCTKGVGSIRSPICSHLARLESVGRTSDKRTETNNGVEITQNSATSIRRCRIILNSTEFSLLVKWTRGVLSRFVEWN